MAESYRVVVRDSAAKEFRSLPSDVKHRVAQAIDNLSSNPRIRGCRKLKGGHGSLYRVRVADYRVVYEVDDSSRTLTITRIRHRSEVY